MDETQAVAVAAAADERAYKAPEETIKKNAIVIQQAAKRGRMNSTPPTSPSAPVNVQSPDPAVNEILRIVGAMAMDIETIKKTNESFDYRIKQLEDSAKHVDGIQEKVLLNQGELIKKNTELEKRVEYLEASLKEVKVSVALEAKLRDDIDLNNRKYNLEMSGIPGFDQEDPAKPMEYCKKMMTLVGSVMPHDMLDVAHRKMNGGIIMRFKSRTARDEVYARRFQLKGITSHDFGFALPQKGNFIFVNESLSHDRSILMQQIRLRLKVINERIPKDDRFKLSSNNGKIRAMDAQKQWKTVTSIQEFERLHPDKDRSWFSRL